LIYTFDQKYILTASIRDDGSSRFASKLTLGDLPGSSRGLADQAGAIPENVNWLSDLKVRASYG
jgi:hypothetical protein